MNTLISYLPSLLSGLSVTLTLTVSATLIGLLLAVLLTMACLSEFFLLRKITLLFINFIRGTPLLVQLFLIYYGVGQFEWMRNSAVWIILREPMACAIIALAINTACYTAVLLKGAIDAVPQGEVMACEALGMSKRIAFWRIILPRAWRLAFNAYSNEVIIVLKCTSLASTITLLDLMGATQELIAQTYDPVTLYVIAGAIYLALNAIIMLIFWALKRKFIPAPM